MSSGTSYASGLSSLLNDFSGVEKHAKHHGGHNADTSLFSSALSMISQKTDQLQNESVDEDHAVKAHKKYYSGGGSGEEATESGMGAAAAMQALKMFNSGGSSEQGSSQEFVGMAMGQAAKLFDQQSESGNVSSGSSKESVVQQAGEMALKMYLQSEGGGSSGSSGLMGLASKFM